MAEVVCPRCGNPNPDDLVECQFCGATLKPLPDSAPADSQSIHPGEEPTRKDTSEFEKVKPASQDSIHPGEIPTKKDTGELERALPSWLRSLRDGKRPNAGESLAEPSANESEPPVSPAAPAQPAHAETDWLAGLGAAAASQEDEEVPDWLAGLRGGKPDASEQPQAPEEPADLESGGADWMLRLGGQADNPSPAAAETSAFDTPETTPEPASGNETPEWLKSMQSNWLEGSQPPPSGDQEPPAGQAPAFEEHPAFETLPESTSDEDTPDWLKSLQSSSDTQVPPAAAHPGDGLPEWLSGLPGLSAESSPDIHQPAESASLTENAPDWLEELKQKSVPPPSETPSGETGSVPDWLSSFGSEPGTPAASSGEDVPDWLSNLETKSSSTAFLGEESQNSETPAEGKPDWLSQLQADANSGRDLDVNRYDSAAVPETPASPLGTGQLPDWLTRIEPSTGPSSSSTPALISDNKEYPPGEQPDSAFSLESPDWLSKLKPEPGTEKTPERSDGQPDTENLEAAELPTWVQAMRPVEAVVDSKTTALDDQATEQSGPLAGLRGVLPSGPGLGTLRKPPAYSVKLQVSEGQNRYAASLEQLIAGESLSRTAEKPSLAQNRIMRWLIAVVLFLAVGLPFASSGGVASPTQLESSDKFASAGIIDGLTGNAPVLVAFDFDPALSGELETVAAPFMDQLLSKNIPLVLISTSPTGPALAEHFMQTTPLVNVHKSSSGNQYIDLGYLAGGPAGILYFSEFPKDAAQFTVDGQFAWQTAPLQSVQGLSNFAAVIILTDNADTGRNWIEQAGPRLGNTPMLMMISAQAEPMIRPYFDSGQVKGLVSGLLDAKIYEQKYGRPGLANHYWNSFSVGMLVVELIILVGAIVSIVSARRALQKPPSGGA